MEYYNWTIISGVSQVHYYQWSITTRLLSVEYYQEVLSVDDYQWTTISGVSQAGYYQGKYYQWSITSGVLLVEYRQLKCEHILRETTNTYPVGNIVIGPDCYHNIKLTCKSRSNTCRVSA